MKSARDIIIRPLVTERTTDLMEENKYTFIVNKKNPTKLISRELWKRYSGFRLNRFIPLILKERNAGWADTPRLSPRLQKGDRQAGGGK